MCQSVQKIMLKCQTGIKWHTALGCWGDGYKWPLYSHGISKATLFWCLHGTLRQSKSAFSFSIYDFQRLIALFKQFSSCIENNYTPRNKTTEENDCGPLDAKIIFICFVKFKYQRRGAKKQALFACHMICIQITRVASALPLTFPQTCLCFCFCRMCSSCIPR